MIFDLTHCVYLQCCIQYSDVNLRDLWDAVSFAGFWKLAAKFWAFGAQEMYRSLNTSAQAKQLQRYIPELKVEDVLPGPAGVRAQAMDRDGSLIHDFVFDSGHGTAQGRILHVRNAPSPGATSSLAIAKMIADRATGEFGLKK